MKAIRHLLIVLGIAAILLGTTLPCAHAQNWVVMPPYNTLWPLWSPVLSPANPVTNVATPLLSALNPTTILPVQPALTWDPTRANPWLLYNTPTGLGFYDVLYGFGAWPPSFATLPLTPAPFWRLLPPTPVTWGQQYLPDANLTYAFLYGLTPADFAQLLTSAAIWGL